MGNGVGFELKGQKNDIGEDGRGCVDLGCGKEIRGVCGGVGIGGGGFHSTAEVGNIRR